MLAKTVLLVLVSVYLLAGMLYASREYERGKQGYPGMRAWCYWIYALAWFMGWLLFLVIWDYRSVRELRRLSAEAEEYRAVRVRSGLPISADETVQHVLKRSLKRSHLWG